MRFINKALSTKSILLIDPSIARQTAADAEKFAFTDILSQVFGEMPKPYKIGSYGIIPVVGVIGKGLSPIERMTGAVDLNSINDQIDAYSEDKEVKTIIFNIDSPGGVVGGVEEISRKISNLSKPTIGYTDGMMCSAAYWIGSACDRVLASPSADVGSIGAFINVIDVSEAYKSMGVKSVVISSAASPLKAAGVEGTSLTEDQKKYFQIEVDRVYADFVDSIMIKRKMAQPEAMLGQSMSGKQAAKMGLLTGISDSLNELIGYRNNNTKNIIK